MSSRAMPPSSRRTRRAATVPSDEARTVEVPRLVLTVEAESGQPASREQVVDGELCRIGSHEGNDVALSDRRVSRFHCNLHRHDGVWRVTDCGSLNGTRINGVGIREADLPPGGALIAIGDSQLRVREAETTQRAEVPITPAFGELVGTSVEMRRLFGMLQRVAASEVGVLLQGESGVGKEAIANELVARGPRAARPLLIIDCGAISPSLIESELFGHARGAFTGADRERIGAFEEAHGGTIFLDEVGELPLDMQPKLLRVLESGQVRRVGENHARQVDVRVVAATNRRLEREVNHGRFREDLFYRLSVVTIRVPPLRERLDDVPVLVNMFLQRMAAGDRRSLFTPQVLAEMKRYDWPGNVRELRNYVERAVVLDEVGPAHDSAPPRRGEPPAAPIDLDQPFTAAKKAVVTDFERRYLSALLTWAQGNVSQAARKAGMDRMYLHRLLQRHGIRRGGSIQD